MLSVPGIPYLLVGSPCQLEGRIGCQSCDCVVKWLTLKHWTSGVRGHKFESHQLHLGKVFLQVSLPRRGFK